ncbi:MAG: trypsin-like peptidase domain-containing protein [Anaerolineae bacterium]|nr:trypsin-like peptidase domain-containing protein [Phycisphaerae bacterium]
MPNRTASFICLLGLSFVFTGCANSPRATEVASSGERRDEKIPVSTQPLIPIKADLAPGVSKESITGGGEPFPPATPRTVVKVTQMVFPAVVRLDVAQEIYSEGKRNLRRGIGSGVIIDDQGHILTNYHVAGRAAEIYVTLFNKERVPAKLIGDDHWTDLAVVQMDLEVLKKRNIPFRHAELGESSSLVPGQDVIAVGTPFGLARTMTLGIVSNNERTFYPEKQKIDEFETGEFSNWIQMDTPIAPGNSGGPLVDLTGKIVGINTRGISGQGLNFAIPIDTAKPVVEDILASASPESKGRVERSDLGIDFRPLQDLESFYDIDINKGALINSVDRGSPAQVADVRTQDILLEINGKTVNVRFPEEVSPARKMIADLPIGSEAKLKIKRGKEIIEVVVKTEKLQSTVGEEKEIKSWGMSVRDVSRAYANEQRLDSDKGVVVTTLNGGYPAAKAELSSGDVILAVNGKNVEDLNEFMTAYNQTTNKRETRVLLALQRGRARQTKVLKITYADPPATAPANGATPTTVPATAPASEK